MHNNHNELGITFELFIKYHKHESRPVGKTEMEKDQTNVPFGV